MKFKDLKTEDKRILIGLCLLPVVITVLLFFKHHVPMKAYYDEDAKELVISPGFLYTLEDYSFTYFKLYTYPSVEEILLPVAGTTDSEYRFRGVPGDHTAGIDLLVSYRDSLTGGSGSAVIHVKRFNDWNSFDIFGDGIFVRFTI